MKQVLFLMLFFISFFLEAQNKKKSRAIKDIHHFQANLNKEFKDSTKSPVNAEERKVHVSHNYFDINLNYRIEAKFVRTPNEKPFQMITHSSSHPTYVKYGEAQFTLNGQELKLNIYQPVDLAKFEGYQDYLIIPFTDLTNGNETFSGGRYIDVRIPSGDVILIDFNKAYNPYCAYSKRFSCPVPPPENNLNVKIEAGVKMTKPEAGTSQKKE